MKKQKTILVTGGAGFIGSHLCEYLLNQGNKVICLDNLLTGSEINIKHLKKNKNFKFINHDIVNPFFIKEKVNQIYNLACPASPIQYQKNAIHTVKANTLGMINVLGLAKKHKARTLQASTSEIYGDPLQHPQKESYWGNVNTIGVRSCYDEGKRISETLMFDYRRTWGIEIKVARIFNTYGPKMAKDDGRVVSNFINQALKNKSITIYGDGKQTRSFQYIDDLIEGLVGLMNSSKIFYGPVNIGNPEEFTIRQLANRIINLTKSKSKIIYKQLPEDDPCKRKPDITLAKKVLNWQPKTNLNEGLMKTISYFKKTI
jgi:UDP-glucuronate decarboxylase